MFHCISSAGQNITDDIRDTLYKTAYAMLISRSKRRKIRSKHCEGVVTSTMESIFYVDQTGIQFEATVESTHGASTVKYLLPNRGIPKEETLGDFSWNNMETLEQGPPRKHPLRDLASEHN